WNKGAEKMYGYTFDEIAGKTPVELRGKESSEEFQKAKEILMQTGAWSGEVWLKRKNGTSILIQSRWTLIKDSNGNPTSILSTNTDITEKRSIEKQLLRSQRLESIGTLASGVAHDLNNLLTPVVLGMELIKLQINDDQGRQRINSLVSIVQRGSSLIQQLLSFAKGKDGPREAMNVRYIIDESVKFVRETFPRNIDVQVDIAKDELIISGDSTQINQVIMNLLINARDAMEVHGGLLTIKASRIVADELLLKRYVDASPGQYIAITVRDTGIGIPPELQDRVFEPFFTTKEQGKGTGIGLTTVFSIVRNYKGFITLYSEIGKGTAFTVYLPYIEQAESDTNYVVSLQKKSVKNECVLFVDDEEFIRSIAADTLVSFGYKVLTAANGEEAMNVFLQNQSEIALVITDVMMPVKGGLELLQDLRKLDPAIKVIAASGLMHSKIASDLQARGVAAVLQKPYTVHELLETVQNTLALKEA
ncbi:MAG TPA: ATP-binding protein, partial [Patescibacteria group bacterium]|nr:ATP-binding protein [Patescibacteria group bacterium]